MRIVANRKREESEAVPAKNKKTSCVFKKETPKRPPNHPTFHISAHGHRRGTYMLGASTCTLYVAVGPRRSVVAHGRRLGLNISGYHSKPFGT